MCHLSTMPKSPVRILHVTNALGLGGTEKVMQLMVTHIGEDFEPTVFSFDGGERAKQLRAEGIDTHIGGDLLKTIQTLQPAIVHIHRGGWPTPRKLQSIRLAGPPVVVETNVFGHYDNSPSAEIIDHTLFVSNFCLERYCKTNKVQADPSRVSVLYNPVDTDFFSKASDHNRDFSRPVAGRISRADPGKWSRLALEILPRLVQDIPDFHYHIIGGIPEAHDYVARHDLEQSVTFHDPVHSDAQIAEFLNTVSLLAHANDSGESFGLVIAEAMACGLPVVTHPCQGLKDNAQLELVDHGVTGLVASSTEEYANAVKFLLTNPEHARAMGRAGQEKAVRLFRAQHIAEQLKTLYRTLLSNKGITT